MQHRHGSAGWRATRSIAGLFLGLVVVAGLTTSAAAQGGDALGPSLSAQQLLADQFVRSGIEMVSAPTGPDGKLRETQLRLAKMLLEQAVSLRPDDAELWRLKAELAEEAGDGEAWLDAHRGYLRLAPQDDAAQLQLIMFKLAESETLDARLTKVDRLLKSSAAKRLSGPLRSRLASYAAAAAREIGDEHAYSEHLKDALRWDHSNAEAARMAVSVVRSRDASDEQLGAAMVNMVFAAPLDGAARLDLAMLLARNGLYTDAAQQFALAAALVPGDLPVAAKTLWLRSVAASGDTATAQAMIEHMGAAQPGDMNAAVSPLELQVVRLALEDRPDRRDFALAAYDQLAASLREMANDEPVAMDDLAWITAVLGPKPEQARAMLDVEGVSERTQKLVRGWLAVAAGDAGEASKWLEPLADTSGLAQLGLARVGNADPAAEARKLREVIREDPAGLPAMLAARRLNLLERDIWPTLEGIAVRKLMDRMPSHLWRMDVQASPWLEVRLTAGAGRFGYMEPVRGQLSVRNVSRVPLAIGPASQIHPQVMVSVVPFMAGQRVASLPPLIVDVGRKLVLEPGEGVIVPARLDHSVLGELIKQHPFDTLTFNATAIFDPRPTQTGGMRSGPLSSSDTVRSLQAWGFPVSQPNVEMWLGHLDSRDPAEQMQAIARLVQLLPGSPSALPDGELATNVARALRQEYQGLGALRQAWMVLFLPAEAEARDIREEAQRSAEPAVRIAYMLTQMTDAKDGAFNNIFNSEKNPTILRFAKLYQRELEARAAIAAQQPQPDVLP